MIGGALADFMKDVRDGLDHFDGSINWQGWLDGARKYMVAMAVAFCFVVVTGSCVAIPVVGLTSAGDDKALARSPGSAEDDPAQPASSPWSLDRPASPPER